MKYSVVPEAGKQCRDVVLRDASKTVWACVEKEGEKDREAATTICWQRLPGKESGAQVSIAFLVGEKFFTSRSRANSTEMFALTTTDGFQQGIHLAGKEELGSDMQVLVCQ